MPLGTTLLHHALTRLITHGRLTVRAADGSTRTYGDGDPAWPDLTLVLADDRVARDMALNPRLGTAEAWIDGRLGIEGGDVWDFVHFVRANNPWEAKKKLEGRRPGAATLARARQRWTRLNYRRRARANVAHHYDLDDRLYDLFLDPWRQYSCAYFDAKDDGGPDQTLDEAQVAKLAHIAAKLDLRPGQRVLDIGCGWGGLARFLHRTCGVHVTGVTLSTEQLAHARAKAEEEGVADHVRFELTDYRDLTGRFDRIVSVGMFEHVGPADFRPFFAKCHDLLADDGVMLIHTIGRMGPPGATDAFTAKYVFPGGYIPALEEIARASAAANLITTDVETLRLHYARTLRAWYDRCVARRAEIEAVYDARFYRLWTFYLAGAGSAFESGGLVNYQLQYTRDRRALPITRGYMAEAEGRIRAAV